MVWELDFKVGNAKINGRERVGMVIARDAERQLLAFAALPQRITFDPDKELPPQVEHFEIPESDFQRISVG
jgi:hypothetical protein